MKIRTLILVATSVATAALGAQDVKNSLQLFKDLNASARGLRENLLQDNDELAQLQRRISASLGELRATWAKTDFMVSAAYHQSLEDNLEALQFAGLRTTPLPTRIRVSKGVLGDFEVKVAAASRGAGARNQDVSVTARTLRGLQEKKGLQVWYVTLPWADKPGRFRRFDQVSSPTFQVLPAGAYVMWSKNPGTQETGTRQRIDIGRRGDRDQTVDLPSPN